MLYENSFPDTFISTQFDQNRIFRCLRIIIVPRLFEEKWRDTVFGFPWGVVRGAWCVVRGAWRVARGAWRVARGAWCVVPSF